MRGAANVAAIVMALAGSAIACSDGNGGAPDAAQADPAPDVAPEIPPEVPADVSLVETSAEAIPGPPGSLAPPVHLFDCTHDPSALPGRVSPVPLSCVIDPGCSRPMVVGHRATGSDVAPVAPENSLSAIRAAIVAGVDGIEMDVRHTADGHLVVIHDDTVDSVTPGTGKVSEMTLEQVRALPVDAYSVSGGDFSCERIATLDEALDLAKGRVFVDLDLKTDHVLDVLAVVRAKGMLDQVFFSSGDNDRLVPIRQVEPGARIQVRPDTPEQFDAATEVFEPDPDVYELPEVPNDFTYLAADEVHALGRKAFANSFMPDVQYMLTGDPGLYLDHYDRRVDILQSDTPFYVLQALGRWRF